MRQRIRYLTTPDGVHLAWAEAGRGPTLVKPANWLTHLEYDWESPVWRHWMHFFAQHFHFIRYDERGSGMTDWHVGNVLSPTCWLADLTAVTEAAGIREPMILLGISQGAATAIHYAASYPERVSRLILYGGYARGWAQRESPQTEQFYHAMLELMQCGWDSDNPTFRQVFTSRFIPGASEKQLGWFNDLCRRTTSAELAVKLLEARGRLSVTELLPQVRAPTLVLHARDDEVVPVVEGRLIASGIPGASFVELESRNHILLGDEPAWQTFRELVLEFTGREQGAAPLFADLSRREREILASLTDGLTNAQIADCLHISEKTVRNHVSHLFSKLGVRSRAQAIVLARDQGFSS
ncbi:alpha/beta fold hydrolase [Halomonas sp. NO4]|uniref:alpha/beta fold hydrolase n=1 Tax=Halomonas sp. NO4 TaxID=2484813 RepID=UPI0013D554FA|nr:alpha/beta fold hydrolase [Halomonas sp. NO4]